jgi:hypothetical protein
VVLAVEAAAGVALAGAGAAETEPASRMAAMTGVAIRSLVTIYLQLTERRSSAPVSDTEAFSSPLRRIIKKNLRNPMAFRRLFFCAPLEPGAVRILLI